MIIKNKLKITLSALLLAASTSAFAAEGKDEKAVVKLNNGQLITWSQFVQAINDPTSTDIHAAPLPDTNPYVKAVSQAKANEQIYKDKLEAREAEFNAATKALKEANDAYNAAVKDKADADSIVGVKNAAVTAAKNAVNDAKKVLNDYIAIDLDGTLAQHGKDGVRTTFNKAEAQLAAWNKQVSDIDSRVNSLTGESTTLSTDISDAEDELKGLQSQYDALGKTVSTTTITTYVPWLQKIKNEADDYLSMWNAYLKNPKKDASLNLYYQLIPGRRNRYTLTLSFSEPDNFNDPDLDAEWEIAESMSGFEEIIYPESEGDEGLTIAVAELYLGQDYTETEEHTLDISFTLNEKIIQGAVSALATLMADPAYYTSVVESTTKYHDPDAEAELRSQIKEKEKEISDLKSQRTAISNQLKTAKTEKENVQKQINGYITAPEGSISEQQRLQNAVTEAEANIPGLEQDITDAESAKEKADDALAAAKDAVTAAVNNITITGNAVAIADAREDNASSAYEAAQMECKNATDAVELAEANLAEAQIEADRAEFKKVYYTVELQDDLIAYEQMTEDFEGRIIGGGHIIEVAPDVPSLFNGFGGNINNVAINGAFAQSIYPNVVYGNVAIWEYALSEPRGTIYDAGGAPTTVRGLGQFGFAIRDRMDFGVDFKTNRIVKAQDAISRVYHITTAMPNDSDVDHYVQLTDDGKFVSLAQPDGFTLPVNHFALTETTDLTGVDNIYFQDGNSYRSHRVVIKDKEPFYCPEDINAEEVILDRKFTQGQNTACLPFPLDYSLSPMIGGISTYDSEEVDKFIFTLTATGVPANTPCIVVGKEDFTLDPIYNVQLKKTSTDQKEVLEGQPDDDSRSYGLFKKFGRDEIQGGANSYKVYGLATSDWKWHPAAEKAVFPSMRMVIYTEFANRQNQAPRRVVFRDEYGNDVTDELQTYINSVSNSEELSIEGGNGEIIITSGADHGRVAIYAVNGKQVAQADVVEGTTSVKLQNGVYVVMGKKVVVK